jgi:hypothetical protein
MRFPPIDKKYSAGWYKEGSVAGKWLVLNLSENCFARVSNECIMLFNKSEEKNQNTNNKNREIQFAGVDSKSED